MIQHEGRFNGVRNLGIHYHGWLPDGDPTAVLLIVHGLGEHCGRYTNVVDHLVPRGYAVYGCDHIGHGRSDGPREVVDRFTDFIDTLTIFTAQIHARHRGKPVILFGHSMGGLIAAHLLTFRENDFKGAILSGPLIKSGTDISKWTIYMGRFLSMLAPGAGILKLDPGGISRDPEVVKAYTDDPLVFHGKTPARLAAEILKAMRDVAANVHKILLPLLILQGSEDKLVDPDGARMIFEKAASRDKTMHVYEGFYHEVFNEPERVRVLEDVAVWLEKLTGAICS